MRDRVLIIEDDTDFAMLELEALGDEYSAEVVSTVAEAQKKDFAAFAAIVLDYRLPDGSGLDLFHTIVGSCNVPIIVLTGITAVEAAVEALRSGAANWLTKHPDTLSVLPLVLRQTIDKRRAREQAEARRIAAEQSLRESDERYRLVVGAVSDVIMQLDLQGHVTFVTPSVTSVFGYGQDEMLSKTLGTITTKPSYERAMAVLQERLAAGNKPPFYPVTLELDLLRKDGTACPCEVRSSFVRDDEGNPVSFVSVVRDISERMAVAEALHRNEDEIEALALEVAQLRSEVRQRYGLDSMVGRESKMRTVFDTVLEVGRTNATVLVQGETGTGKELVAKAIHYNSSRRDLPFVKVDCGALAENLLESELFGHVKGSFTGAVGDKRGRFELAAGGTIFLDEIHNLSHALQAKLLRVVQDGSYERVGDSEPRQVDVRIVAATNEDLKALVSRKEFRIDLYYRLNVIPIMLPPLRERAGDIPLLVSSFIKRFSERHEKAVRGASEGALAKLREYSWPGNVRELENIIEQAVVFSQGPTIAEDDIRIPEKSLSLESGGGVPSGSATLRKGLEDPERRLIIDALRRTSGNRKRAAEVLGISRSALYERLKRYDITDPV